MRVALISDIHGNFVSLQAVLADLEQQEVDHIVCLGDVATLGPQPHEVVERLRQLNCACVMGNHDAFVLDPQLLHSYMDAPWFAESIEWSINQLAPDDFEYLRAFKALVSVEFDGDASMLCFHGSPHSNIDIILATTPSNEVDKMLSGYKATVMAGGHTHVQMFRQHNGLIILNPGSVGMPFEQMPFTGAPRILPQAEYAVITWNNGVISVDLRRVPIDLEAVKHAALESELPEPDEWVKNWITKLDFI